MSVSTARDLPETTSRSMVSDSSIVSKVSVSASSGRIANS